MLAKIWDALGVGLSGLCLVHCLALPLVAIALPMLGSLSEAPWVHWAFVATATPVTMLAFGPLLARRPAPLLIPGLGAAGIALLTFGALNWPNHAWGEGVTLIGALVLSSAHVLNWRRGHRHVAHAH